ncbi:hypothetical protein QTH81_00845 [Clostridium perfringens]|nr:hypothetical protein [Clostridium perfringens]
MKNRIGERRIMKCGEECEIVEYRSARDITVKFLKTEELVKCQYNNFKIGNIKSHFTPSVYGVGIVGLEQNSINGKQFRSYDIWNNMLQRCYDKKLKEKRPTYSECSVCSEWLYYSNFKKWYEKNYYEVNNEIMCLDKDILNKGNKIYSPDNCIFVPQSINSLFIKSNANRGDLPIGVSFTMKETKYICHCSVFDINTKKSKVKHLGLYNTPEEAFYAYKKAKEENIKQVADYYKDQIPERLYEAMCKYEVEITD